MALFQHEFSVFKAMAFPLLHGLLLLFTQAEQTAGKPAFQEKHQTSKRLLHQH